MKTANDASTMATITRLRPGGELGARQVDGEHLEQDRGDEHVVPRRAGVVADEQRGGVAAEGDRDHRSDDHDRGDIAEPRRDADEPPLAEALDQVGDKTARGRVAHAELDTHVAEHPGDDAADQERDPHARAGDRSRLAQQREDAGPDHRADAEDGRAAGAQLALRRLGAVPRSPPARVGRHQRVLVSSIPTASGVTTVPASPRTTAAASLIEPIAATPPVCVTNRQAASTFGPIEPAANAAAASAAGVARRIAAASGVPQSRVDGVDVGDDRQHVGVQLRGEQRAREILVDHRFDPDEPPARGDRLVGVHDRDAASARAHHHAVVLEHPLDGLEAVDVLSAGATGPRGGSCRRRA